MSDALDYWMTPHSEECGCEDCEGRRILAAEIHRLRAEVERQQKRAILLYNLGYRAGHKDTVEACYVDIVASDMETYHADVVGEILETLRGGEG